MTTRKDYKLKNRIQFVESQKTITGTKNFSENFSRKKLVNVL